MTAQDLLAKKKKEKLEAVVWIFFQTSPEHLIQIK
jgi:hypothetical protein